MSAHLQEIIERHNHVANVQTVFVDIEAYSKRKTQNQISVIAAFTECLREALRGISQRYVGYAQANNVNMATDIIVLPTGDGAAVGFSFSGLHDIHLCFASALLTASYERRATRACDRFDADGYCNCHDYFNVRVGISEGKAIVYRDVNDNYNLAGATVNLGARVMGLVGRNQLAFSHAAYEQFVDLADDPNIADHFRLYHDVTVKHGLHVTVAQYQDDSVLGLNGQPVASLEMMKEERDVYKRLVDLGLPAGVVNRELDRPAMLSRLKAMEEGFRLLVGSGAAADLAAVVRGSAAASSIRDADPRGGPTASPQ